MKLNANPSHIMYDVASSLSSSSSAILEDITIVNLMKERHEQEYNHGATLFGTSTTTCVTHSSNSHMTLLDDSILEYNLGRGNGGPSESFLGHCIYQTKHPILTTSECDEMIQIGREAIEASIQSAQDNQDVDLNLKKQLNEARLGALSKEGLDRIRSLLQDRFYPLVMKLFGDALEDHPIALYDGLILSHVGPSRNQPLHRDASLLTLNIALSDPADFLGGGTFIDGMNTTLPLRIGKGEALCHASGVMHAGTGIQSGSRWVMVLFFLCQNQHDLARRCHAQALDLIDAGDLVNAQRVLEVGLQVAPKDHLLLMALGKISNIRGEESLSFEYLKLVTQYYPLAHTANIAMGQMLLRNQRPRAALRRFQNVMRHIGVVEDRSFLALKAHMWEVQVSTARCTLLCAEWDASHHDPHERDWTRKHLPGAKLALENALMFAQDDERLQDLWTRLLELERESVS